MLAAILAALGPFIQMAWLLIQKAITAKQDQHAQILADLQAAAQKLADDLAGLPGKLAADDAAADAELAAKFPSAGPVGGTL